MSRLDEVQRDRRTHLAKTDKAHVHHALPGLKTATSSPRRRIRRPTAPRSPAQRGRAEREAYGLSQPTQNRPQSALRDLALADVFAVAVVVELVDDTAFTVGASAVAWTDAEVDDDRRAVADNDWRRGPRRSRDAAPAVPTPTAPTPADKKLIPVKAVRAKAIEAVEAEAVEAEAIKPVRAKAVEPETIEVDASVEPARRKTRKMTAPKNWPSKRRARPAHASIGRREAEGEDESRRGAAARSPQCQGNTHRNISGAATSILTAIQRRCPW